MPYQMVNADNCTESYFIQEFGTYCHDLPCGRFVFADELGFALCGGCYELIEAQTGEPSFQLRLLDL